MLSLSANAGDGTPFLDYSKLRLDTVIGAGAFAKVYQGEYEGLGPVAVKVLAPARPGPIPPQYVRLFMQEAGLLWQLRHTHLLRCHGVTELPAGAAPELQQAAPAMIMELAGRATLRDVLLHAMQGRRRYRQRQALAWLRGLAAALQFLHEATPPAVHRDIKAENILFVRRQCHDTGGGGGGGGAEDGDRRLEADVGVAAGGARAPQPSCVVLADLGLSVRLEGQRGVMLRRRAGQVDAAAADGSGCAPSPWVAVAPDDEAAVAAAAAAAAAPSGCSASACSGDSCVSASASTSTARRRPPEPALLSRTCSSRGSASSNAVVAAGPAPAGGGAAAAAGSAAAPGGSAGCCAAEPVGGPCPCPCPSMDAAAPREEEAPGQHLLPAVAAAVPQCCGGGGGGGACGPAAGPDPHTPPSLAAPSGPSPPRGTRSGPPPPPPPPVPKAARRSGSRALPNSNTNTNNTSLCCALNEDGEAVCDEPPELSGVSAPAANPHHGAPPAALRFNRRSAGAAAAAARQLPSTGLASARVVCAGAGGSQGPAQQATAAGCQQPVLSRGASMNSTCSAISVLSESSVRALFASGSGGPEGGGRRAAAGDSGDDGEGDDDDVAAAAPEARSTAGAGRGGVQPTGAPSATAQVAEAAAGSAVGAAPPAPSFDESIAQHLRRVSSMTELLAARPSLGLLLPHTKDLNWVYGLTGRAGSAMTMAPEVFLKLPYNEKVDVFSLGVVAYELLSRQLLLAAYMRTDAGEALGVRTPLDYAQKVAEGFRPPRPAGRWHMSDAQWGLVSACWAADPCERPTMAEVVSRLDTLLADPHAYSPPPTPRAADAEEEQQVAVAGAAESPAEGGAPGQQACGCGCVVS